MAVLTAPPKQTLHNQPALIALGEALHLLPHHTKPFRRRHIAFLAVCTMFVLALALEVGVVVTHRSLNPGLLFSRGAVPVPATSSTVRSSQGFSFVFNNQQFTATVQSDSVN